MTVLLFSSVITLSGFLANTADVFELEPKQFLGIPIALAGAILMSFGTQYQSRGLNKVEVITKKSAGSGLSLSHVFHLLARPSWVIGTVMLGLAVVLQLGALSFSPLIVVQPLGVVALVITSILNARISGIEMSGALKTAITLCVTGIVVFVSVAAFTTKDSPVRDIHIVVILVIFAAVTAVLMFAYITLRYRAYAIFYILGAGVLYAFVATFAKTIIAKVQQGEWDPLMWLALVALVLGAVLGMLFVQNAHSSGPPDLVIAGLTVVDPLVAVLIGILVLGEAQHAPLWAIFVFIGAAMVACLGVLGLAKFHPQVGKSALAEDDAD